MYWQVHIWVLLYLNMCNNNNESLHHKQSKTLHDCNASIYNWSLHVNAGRAIRRHRVLALCWAQGFVVHSLNIIIIYFIFDGDDDMRFARFVATKLPSFVYSSSSNDNHKFRLYNKIGIYVCV